MLFIMAFCFYFCQVFKIAWVIIQTGSTFNFRFLVLIALFCMKCLQLSRLKAKCCRYFISLEFCELIRKKCDEFLSFILHAIFYITILIYFSSNVVFSYFKNFLTFSVIYMPFVIIKY